MPERQRHDGPNRGRSRRLGSSVLRGLIVASVLALTVTGHAVETMPEGRDKNRYKKPVAPVAPELEIGVDLPPFPRADGLVELDPDLFGGGVRVFLDAASISQPQPGVVRYTVLFQSRSGAASIFYEGIRCDAEQWRSYAYGTRQGKFRSVANRGWKTLRAGGTTGYRRSLARAYVCANDQAPDRARELRRMLRGQPQLYGDTDGPWK